MGKQEIEKRLGRKLTAMENNLHDIHYKLVGNSVEWNVIFEHGTFNFKKK